MVGRGLELLLALPIVQQDGHWGMLGGGEGWVYPIAKFELGGAKVFYLRSTVISSHESGKWLVPSRDSISSRVSHKYVILKAQVPGTGEGIWVSGSSWGSGQGLGRASVDIGYYKRNWRNRDWCRSSVVSMCVCGCVCVRHCLGYLNEKGSLLGNILRWVGMMTWEEYELCQCSEPD